MTILTGKAAEAARAFKAGESVPKLEALKLLFDVSDKEYLFKRLDEVTPAQAGLDPITFAETRRALIASLLEG